MQTRYYDPVVGRFLATDPLQFGVEVRLRVTVTLMLQMTLSILLTQMAANSVGEFVQGRWARI